MYELKFFKSKEALNKWKNKNKNKYIINEIFINNGFALEIKKYKKIKI